jgi:hypothetical protein
MDFGVDQLDIKKVMKPKLGPNVVLRLRFGPGSPSSGGAIGNKGYGIIKTTDDVEMVSVTLNDHGSESNMKVNTADTVDSQTGLLDKKAQ